MGFFEWDENQRQANIEKHGIDFADIRPIFSNLAEDLISLKRGINRCKSLP